MKKYFLLILAFLVIGCSARHVEEIMRVQAVSKEMEAQQSSVQAQDSKFKELLVVVENGSIKDYQTQTDFIKNFGQPIFTKILTEKGKWQELWLYRYSGKLWGSEKVYLYFDSAGNLVKWEHRPAESQ